MLSPDSVSLARDIWCSPSPHDSAEKWMRNAETPQAAAQSCKDPSSRVLQLGAQLHVNATPVIYFQDGSRITGAMDLADMKIKLSQ